jgi:hypothetical protein
LASHFQELLPLDFLDQALSESGAKRNNGLYTLWVVLWLLIWQRLQGGASMESAVMELLQSLPSSFWPRPCKRIRDWRERGQVPSSNTAAYNQARQALPLSIVEKSSDHIFNQLTARLAPPDQAGSPRAFILDGSSVRAPHTAELCKVYPPGSNQHGEAHWPVLRMVVAHDLYTGLAMRPEWGAMYGDEAVSEQALLERAIDRLPAQAMVIGDANFGVFSVAFAATQRGYPVLLRLTAERARRLAGEPLRDGVDRAMTWKPTAADRKSHPELQADACVSGRLLIQSVQRHSSNPFLLALFTTDLSSSVEEVLHLYGQRWNVETDLRTLKSTLALDQLTCSTPDMVAKEIDMGFTTYNLVRALIGFASEQSGIPPRGYRFTKVRLILQAFGPKLANAATPQEAQQIMGIVMKCLQQSKLPKRRQKRPPSPRAVWKRGAYFPTRTK